MPAKIMYYLTRLLKICIIIKIPKKHTVQKICNKKQFYFSLNILLTLQVFDMSNTTIIINYYHHHYYNSNNMECHFHVTVFFFFSLYKKFSMSNK